MKNAFEFIVNNTVMDLFPDGSNPKLNRKADNYKEPDKNQIDRSFVLNLPKTAKNLNALGLTDSKASYGLFQQPRNYAILTFNSLTLINGVCIIDNITHDTISVVVYSRFIDVADACKNKTLQQLTSFPLTYWDYENTIKDHVNHNYGPDDYMNPIPPFTSADQIDGYYPSTGHYKWVFGFNPIVSISSASTSGATLCSDILRLRFIPTVGVAYTFNYSFTSVTETGTYNLIIGFFNNTTKVISQTIAVTAGTMTGTVSLTAPSACNHIGFYLQGVGSSCSVTLSTFTQTTPKPTDPVTHQFPFIMYERYYTIKRTINSHFQGPGPGFTPGSETSDGMDYQRGQFLILSDVQGATTQPPYVINYAEYGNFPACMYVSKVLKAIIQEAGWNIGGSLLQNENFKKLIIPPTGSGEFWESAISSNFESDTSALDLFEAHRSSNWPFAVNATGSGSVANPAAATWHPIYFDVEDSDPNANYNPANGKYTFSTDYRAQFTAHILGNCTMNFPQVDNQNYAVWRIMSSIKGEIIRKSFKLYKATAGPIGTGNKDFLLQTSTLDFVPGEEVWVEQAAWGTIAVSGTMTTFTNSSFYNTIVGGVDEVANLNVVAFLPKMKQLDFLRQYVLIPFNAFLYIDDASQTVFFEPYENFILPNSQAVDLSDQIISLNYKINAIVEEDRSIQIVFAENDNDDVPYMPNQYTYPADYNEMVRIRKKELTIGGIIYKNNEIYNYNKGIKVISSQLSPTNFRKYFLVNSRNFVGSTVSSNAFWPVVLPSISTIDDMTQEWFTETETGADDRPAASELSFGSGNRLLKYEGIDTYVAPSDGITEYDIYYLYLNDPGIHSTSGGDTIRDKVYIGHTSYLDTNAILYDDKFNEYFNTGYYTKIDSALHLSANSDYYYSDPNDPTAPRIGWQINSNGDLINITSDIYNLHYAKKYEMLAFSDIMQLDVHFKETDWNKLKVNTPVMVYGIAYTLVEISNYQPLDGLASIKIMKRLT